MKNRLIALALAFGSAACLSHAQSAPPPASPPATPPAAQAAHPPRKIHVLPPGARERLNLTADQAKQLDAVEADVQAKIEKILTPDQLRKLQHMHGPRGHRGRRGPDDADGPPPPPPPPPSQ